MYVFERPGVTLPLVSKASESYTGRVIYENNEARTVGTISIKAPTPSSFNTDVINYHLQPLEDPQGCRLY
jgi:hypothetical protein